MHPKDIANLVKEWVKEASDRLRMSLSNADILVEEKTNPSDVVTEMDRAIEAFYVEQIRTRFPEHRIFGEEGTYEKLNNLDGFVWIIDPIDGTLNYVKQKRNFCTMIALLYNGEGVVACVGDVLEDDIYISIQGEGVYYNENRLPAIEPHPLNEGLLAINTKMAMSEINQAHPLLNEALGLRLIGSAGLEMIQVLTNRVSAYVTTPLYAWDIAPGYVMAKELGLLFTKRDGSPINLLEKNDILIANPVAHKQIVEKFSKK